MKFGFDNTK